MTTAPAPFNPDAEANSLPPFAAARRQNVLLPALVFLGVFLVHSLSCVVQSYDSAWSVHTALSIVKEGNTNIDEYRDDVERGGHYLYETINGHIYSSYPIGTPLLSVPFVYMADLGLRLLSSVSPRVDAFLRRLSKRPTQRVDAASLHGRVEVLVASLFVALTAVLMYLVGCRFLGRFSSVILACIFAFCTSAWSTASRGLWQHGPSMLMLAVALLLIVKARERPFLVQFASIPLAFSFVIRPTNALSIIALTFFVVVRHRRFFLQYLAWSVVVVVPFVWYNLWLYHAILPPYFSPHKVGATVHLFEGLAGNLVSPSRGLLVYSPVFLLAIYGMVSNLKKAGDRLLDCVLVAIVVAHWFVISSFPDWYGGHCYGPRYFTDVVPFFVYFLIPVLAKLSELRGPRRVALASVFGLLVLVSAFTNGSGAMNRATEFWNSSPVDVDKAPGRVWDWRDPQFLRGIVRRPLTIGNPTPHDEGGSQR